MDKNIITFSDIEIEQSKYHYSINSILIDDIDVNKTLISKKDSFSEKYYKHFIG